MTPPPVTLPPDAANLEFRNENVSTCLMAVDEIKVAVKVCWRFKP